jgi:hypothetical protein
LDKRYEMFLRSSEPRQNSPVAHDDSRSPCTFGFLAPAIRFPSFIARKSQCRAPGTRGIHSRQDDRRSFVRRIPQSSQSVVGAGQCKLRCPQARNEITTTNLTGILHGAKHIVYGGKTTRNSCGQNRFPRKHAVAIEERSGTGRPFFRFTRTALELFGQQ